MWFNTASNPAPRNLIMYDEDTYSACDSDLRVEVGGQDDEDADQWELIPGSAEDECYYAAPRQVILSGNIYHTRKSSDPNWNTLALLYEKPGVKALQPLSTARHSYNTPARLRPPLESATAYVLVIFEEDDDTTDAQQIQRRRQPVPSSSPVMEEWLATRMRHEQWWS